MSRRASRIDIPYAPPYFPADFVAFATRVSPTSVPYTSQDASNPFWGKSVLVLSGADDPVVPWVSSETFVEKLQVGQNGVKKVIVYPGVGHKCTDEMVKETSEFVWEQILSQGETGSAKESAKETKKE